MFWFGCALAAITLAIASVISLILGGLLIGLLLALAALASRPQTFLTTRTVSKAIRVFGASYRPRWKSLAFEIRSFDFWTKEISLRATDFCFEKADTQAEGCIKSLDTRFTVEFHLVGARLVKVSTLTVAGDHFTIKPAAPNQFGLVQGEGNVIAPGKRPLSSMAPTIVLKDGAVEMVAGSPGGPRIISTPGPDGIWSPMRTSA